MPFLAFDTETSLIKDDEPVPELICLTYRQAYEEPKICLPPDVPGVIEWYANLGYDFVGHFTPFDFAVIKRAFPQLEETIWRLYDGGRVYDTQIAELLLVLRKRAPDAVRYKLADLAKQYLKVELAKGEDTWRLRYGELKGVPLDRWPKEALDYALGDAEMTWQVWEAQQKDEPFPYDQIQEQCRAHWSLHLTSREGLKADGRKVEALDKEVSAILEASESELIAGGIYHRKKNGQLKINSANGRYCKNTKEIQRRISVEFEKMGLAPPRTPTGGISYADEVLRGCDDPVLQALSSTAKASKIKTSFIPMLKKAAEHPLYTTYNPIMATGRVSSERPNFQQLPREGGVRECFIPSQERGAVFINCDYVEAELVAMAQVLLEMFGTSSLRDAYLTGKKPHLVVAAQILQISYADCVARFTAGDEEVKRARQFAKVANYGMWGGLSPQSLARHAKRQGVTMTLDEAKHVYDVFFQTWVEAKAYFKKAAQVCGPFGNSRHVAGISGRERAQVVYTEWANAHFQTRIADVAKLALYRVVRACYVEELSPLFGCRPKAFLHDEIMIEAEEDRAPEAAEELSRVMNAAALKYIPDVPIQSEPSISRCWYKDAKSVRDLNGRLLVWEPKEKKAA